MGRATKVILTGALVGVASAALAYLGAMRLSVQKTAGSDDLAWLRHEFRLNDSEMERIRQLHEGYLPKCREMCAKIAAKRAEIDEVLSASTSAAAVTEQKLVELGALRAQCQAQMLRHFEEVSRAMPAEQGKRYLAEMQRQTLGFHERFENSMGEGVHSGHVHGDH